MNYLCLFLVSLLAIQVNCSPFQPTDLRENATLLLSELSSRSDVEVNAAFEEIWPLPETLNATYENALTEGVQSVQDSIDNIYAEIQQLKDDALDNGLDFESCQGISDDDIAEFFQGVKDADTECDSINYHRGINHINQILSRLNNILAEVSNFSTRIADCNTDRCLVIVIDEIQISLDTLSLRLFEARISAEVGTTFWSTTIDNCAITSEFEVNAYGLGLTSYIKDCLGKE